MQVVLLNASLWQRFVLEDGQHFGPPEHSFILACVAFPAMVRSLVVACSLLALAGSSWMSRLSQTDSTCRGPMHAGGAGLDAPAAGRCCTRVRSCDAVLVSGLRNAATRSPRTR